MIQKGDDLINGVNHNYQYPNLSSNQMIQQNNAGFVGNHGNLIQAMSFEDYAPPESTLPPVETVLPQYIPTPPPSLPSPSVNISNVNTTTVPDCFQFQHQTSVQIQQHNQNINNSHQYQCEQLLSQQQHPQQNFNFHSSPSNKMQFTMETHQLFEKHNKENNEPNHVNIPSNDTSPNTSHNHSIQSQETILNASDTSTVDAEENLNDEQYTYLQNLNSDNLMKFSQQSVLQQLIQEQIDIKPNLNLIPTCEEHDHGGYNFGIQVTKYAQRPGVVFSKDTQRLYCKTNENIYIDCFYTQKMPIQPLRLRVFPIFEKDASCPVLRCQNHISTDTDPNEVVRKSMLRCKNADVVYSGCDMGKSINDRYTLVVPLNSTVKTNETNQLKQQLILSFTCYNSCMNRKQTSVIFLLEGMNGEILAQRTLSVKISTCPKRDLRLYETLADSSNKRKHIEDPNTSATDPKMAKYDNTSIRDEYSRSSYDEASDDGIPGNTFSGNVHQEKETGDFVLTLKYKSHEQLLQTIMHIYGGTTVNEFLGKTSANGKRPRDSDCILKLYQTANNIKTRNNRSSISME